MKLNALYYISFAFAGDKANHVPALHVPQLYYFVAAATFFGWPVLISGKLGLKGLAHGVWGRMFGGKMYSGFITFIATVC